MVPTLRVIPDGLLRTISLLLSSHISHIIRYGCDSSYCTKWDYYFYDARYDIIRLVSQDMAEVKTRHCSSYRGATNR